MLELIEPEDNRMGQNSYIAIDDSRSSYEGRDD